MMIAGLSTNIIGTIGYGFIFAVLIHTITQFKVLRYQLSNLRVHSITAVHARYEKERKAKSKLAVLKKLPHAEIKKKANKKGETIKSKEEERKSTKEVYDVNLEMEKRLRVCIVHHQALTRYALCSPCYLKK